MTSVVLRNDTEITIQIERLNKELDILLDKNPTTSVNTSINTSIRLLNNQSERLGALKALLWLIKSENELNFRDDISKAEELL